MLGPASTPGFFGGDSGYTPAFADIGAQHGPFDLTLLPIGAYDARWPDVHMDPAEAVRAHAELRGGVLLPIHWATFDLAFHDLGGARGVAARGGGRARRTPRPAGARPAVRGHRRPARRRLVERLGLRPA